MNARLLPLGLLSVSIVLPQAGFAQALPPLLAPPSAPASEAAPQTTTPPPSLVGRIASITGSVSFHFADATSWQVASRNLPVTSGTALWVAPPSGEAAIGVADNRIVLAPSTELDVNQLDEQTLAATAPQGESYWHLRSMSSGQSYIVHTPRGTITMATAGRYEIASGDTEHPTTVTVLDGAATLTDVPTTQEVGAGQTLTITGDGSATPFNGTIGPAVQDAFLRHVLAEEAPPRPRPPAAPAIVSEMTGAEALLDVGQWAQVPEYGPVWYPPSPTYVPYRQGHWAYVAPWGWTWVDDAPWGFAPSHYGRWAQYGGRWCWVPGREWVPDRPPVYAPALVAFIGGVALGAGAAALTGWAPLGPHEVYRPPYFVGPRALEALNAPYGARFGAPGAPPPGPIAIARSAVTIVPTQILTTSAPVAPAFQARSGVSIGPNPVLQFRPQAVPTAATLGVTHAELQRVNPAGLAVPAAHLGAGPGFARPGNPQAALVRPEGARPEFGRPGAPPPIGPAAAPGAAVGLAHPEGLPMLRQRGAMPPDFHGGARGDILSARPAGPAPQAAPAPGRVGPDVQPGRPDILNPGHPGTDVLSARPQAPRAPDSPARPTMPPVRDFAAPQSERRPDIHPAQPPARPMEPRAPEARAPAPRAPEQRAFEQRAPEQRAFEQRPSEPRPPEQRAADQRAFQPRSEPRPNPAAFTRAPEQRGPEPRGPEQRPAPPSGHPGGGAPHPGGDRHEGGEPGRP